jgi:hypothetical protein
MKKIKFLCMLMPLALFASCGPDNPPTPPKATSYTITVTSAGHGTATADATTATEGTEVKITATPEEGYLFDEWTATEGGISLTDATAATTSFTMPAANVKVEARFIEEIIEEVRYSLTVSAGANGSVEGGGSFLAGETVTVTATPDAKFMLAGWTVAEGGITLDDAMANPLSFTMPEANVSISAEFAADAEYDLLAFIPDSAFKSWCRTNADINGDDKVTEAEAASLTEMNISARGISSLTGIEYFTGLTSLNCSDNQISTLDLSACAALTTLNCTFNKLTSLNLSGNPQLTDLSCYTNALTSLDISANPELLQLNCSSNALEALDLSNNLALENIYCNYNAIASLDLTDHTSLSILMCFENQITSLKLQGCTSLSRIQCYTNKLTSLDLSNLPALADVQCFENSLTSLNISGSTAILYLDSRENLMSELDASDMSIGTGTYQLYCGSQTSNGDFMNPDPRTLTLTLRPEQLPYWESNMSWLNENVVLAE